MVHPLCAIRRDLGLTQCDLAKRMGVAPVKISAVEFGLGHGGDARRTAKDFPTETFFTAMDDATAYTIRDPYACYLRSCALGDSQEFQKDELPAKSLHDLLARREIDVESLGQMAAVSVNTLEDMIDGKCWAPTASLHRLASALRVPALHLDCMLWAAHHRRTHWLSFRGILPASRPRRPARVGR